MKRTRLYLTLTEYKCFALLLTLPLWLVSCVGVPMTDSVALPEPDRKLGQENVSNEVVKRGQVELLKVPDLLKTGGRGADTEPLMLPKGKLKLSVDAMPLNRFIHVALGEVLELSYDVDPLIASRVEAVTLRINSPVKAERLLGMVEESLRLFDVALVQSGQALRVLPASKLKSFTPSVVTGKHKALLKLGRVMEFIPLHYADPGEVMLFANQFLGIGSGGDVFINQRLNALLVIGEAEKVVRFREAVTMVDRPSLEGKQLRLIRPVYWQAKELARVLKDSMEAQGIPVSRTVGGGKLSLFPIEEINALVVSSPRREWLSSLLEWVDKLDTLEAANDGKGHFIYFLKNSRAKELGGLLSAVLSGSGSSAAQEIRSDKKTSKTPGATVSSVSRQPAGGLSVIVDEIRNALIFVGPVNKYKAALGLVKELDLPPRQVLIEATVAEVTLDDTTSFGVESSFGNVDNSQSLTGSLAIGGLGVGTAGLSYLLRDVAGGIRLKLNALASQGKVKLLSKPVLLAMDNETAKIQVGTQIQIVSQEVADPASAGNSLIRTFKSVDTGVILEITPTINEGGVVQLTVHQEVSEAGASANNTPPILKRSVDTKVLAISGQTIVLGGLISHTKSITKTKVPLLGDIPILGSLFSHNVVSDRVTELIILITPHIVSNSHDMDQLKNAFQNRLTLSAD